MDAALKSRNLGSAAVRRQRMQERQVQKHLAYQQQVDRRRLMTTDIEPIDDSDADAESETSSNMDTGSAAETPSETSVQTPDNTSSSDAFITLSPTVYDGVAETNLNKLEVDLPEIKSENVPKMQATLTTMADWNYDRFSMLIEPSDVEGMLAALSEEEHDASSSDEDETEEYSPIEIATPVSYVMPTTKPSVISIMPMGHSILPLSINKRPTIRRHVSEQMSSNHTREAPETRGPRFFHASNSSRDTLGSTNGSSQVSRSVSLASQNDSIVSRSVSQTSQSDQSSRSPKRKSSMPLLFGNNKNGHSRMSSIKKFIRSSTLGPPAPSHSHNFSFQRSASGATLETHFEDRGGSMEVMRRPAIQDMKRPMTARAPSPVFPTMDNVTALPTSPPLPKQREPDVQQVTFHNEEAKPKSVSKFRSRSGSIGQALKSMSSGPKRTDASAPPLPAILIPPPSSQSRIFETEFPAPPPLTPRNPKRITATYSPFPSSEKRSPTFADKTINPSTVSVGLGLHY